jgi:hypothetical protein
MITPPLSISAMPRLTRAVPVKPVGVVGLVISDTVNPSSYAVFPDGACCNTGVRNNAFRPSV